MAEYGGGDSGGSTALKEMQAVPVLCVCVGVLLPNKSYRSKRMSRLFSSSSTASQNKAQEYLQGKKYISNT